MIISCKNTNIESAHSDMMLTTKNSRFYHDTESDEIVEVGFNRRTKKPSYEAICKNFDVLAITTYRTPSTPLFVKIEYITKNQHFAEMVPYTNYSGSHFELCFNGVERLPKCSDISFDNLVKHKISNVPIAEVEIPYRQGLFIDKRGNSYFVGKQDIPAELEPYFTESVQMRKPLKITNPPGEIIERWNAFYGQDPKLKILSNLRTTANLSYYYYKYDTPIHQLGIIKPSEQTNELDINKLSTLLLSNFTAYVLPENDDECSMFENYQNIWDAINLIVDLSNKDGKISDALTEALEYASFPCPERNVSVLISEKATELAVDIAPSGFFSMDVSGVKIHHTSEGIVNISDEFESLVFTTIMGCEIEINWFFKNEIPRIKKELSAKYSGEMLNTTTALIATELFLTKFFNIKRLDDEMLNAIEHLFDNN